MERVRVQGEKKGPFADISRKDFAVTLNIYPFHEPAFFPLDIYPRENENLCSYKTIYTTIYNSRNCIIQI